MNICNEILWFEERVLTDVYDIDPLFVMQIFIKVAFKMTEKLPHTLGGGLEIWASICTDSYNIRIWPKFRFSDFLHFQKAQSFPVIYYHTTKQLYTVN